MITASIGGTSGWSDGPWAEVASRLVDQGVIVTIAAGNEGSDGPFLLATVPSGKNVIAVASVDTNVVAAPPFKATFTVDGTSNTSIVGYMPDTNGIWYMNETYPIIPISFDTTDDAQACEPFSNGSLPDLSGAVALVRRGTCTFAEKQYNLAQVGAKYILVYNNDSPVGTAGGVDPAVRMGLIDAALGRAIINTVRLVGWLPPTLQFPRTAAGALVWSTRQAAFHPILPPGAVRTSWS